MWEELEVSTVTQGIEFELLEKAGHHLIQIMSGRHPLWQRVRVGDDSLEVPS